MHSVKKGIALSNCLSKKLLFPVGSVGLDHAADFVDLAVYFSIVNEVTQLLVEKVSGHAESPCHVFDRHRLEGLQVLTVGYQAHLTGVVVCMFLKVLVFLYLG